MLRIFKKVFSRSVPVLLLCCMFFILFSPAVSADGINYKDYISDITVDGHNDLVEIRIPADEQYFILTNETQGWSTDFQNGYLDLVADGTSPDYDKYTIQLHPFPGGKLDLSDIPDDTRYVAGFFYSYSGPGYETPYVSCNEQYYSGSSWLGQIQNNVGFEPALSTGYVTSIGRFNKSGPYSNGVSTPADGVDLFLQFYNYSPLTNDFIMLQAEDFVLTMTISSLYELQQSQDKTNEILEAVEDKLEENGQKLDDIINGEVAPEAPPGSDVVDDANNVEQDILDDTQGGLDDAEQLQQSSLDILYQYWTAFAAFSWLFSLFTDLPWLYGLLAVSLSFGVIGSLLNLIVSSASKSSSRSDRSNSSKGG